MTLQRTESFVPLTAAPVDAGRREFHVAVISQDAPARSFHALETPSATAGEGFSAGGKKLCEPRLSVQSDGDRVTSIRVQCTCGQVMDLACVYDVPPPAA